MWRSGPEAAAMLTLKEIRTKMEKRIRRNAMEGLMITVMLADDNKFALKHFAGLVEWEKFGFQLIDTAIDGIEAWEKFCRWFPNVVITDVQMPGIDGMELARRIKEKRPETIVIFLSSYDDFDYARSAIDLSVQEYILKQELDRATFESKLQEIRKILQKKTEKRKKIDFGNLLTCFHTAEEDLDDEFYQEIFQDLFHFLILEQDHMPEVLAERSGYMVPEIDYRTVFSDIQKEIPEIVYIIRLETYRWICLCDTKKEIEAVGDAIVQYLAGKTEATFSMMIFSKEMSVMECRRMYEKMEFLSEQRYFEGTSAVMYAEMYEKPKTSKKIVTDDFLEAFEKNDKEMAVRILDRTFRMILYRYDFLAFEEAVEQVLLELENKQKQLYEPFELYDEEVCQLMSVRRIVRWLKEKVIEILEIRKKEQHFTSDAMERAVRFIYQEYKNSFLSVEGIAENAGLSVNRLNDLFKKEQGETVGKFLTKVRMEKARELLEKENEKIPDIVEQVGYSSPSYFAKVFRKMYDISPQEYRKKGKENE